MAQHRGPRAQTPPSSRPSSRPSSWSSSRLASLFFAIGCLAVLTVAFALGVAAGRRWPTGVPLPGLGGAPAATTAAAVPGSPARGAPAPPRGERDTARRAEGRSLDKGKTTTDVTPELTFYRELTAPLSSTPTPARAVAKRDSKTAEPAKAAPRPAESMKPLPSEAAHVEASPREPAASASPASIGVSGSRFTVQVGAFKARAQAEALRTRLAEAGQEADLTEGEAAGVTQYRVRVGTFATRAAARDAAARLGAERQLATYVTTR